MNVHPAKVEDHPASDRLALACESPEAVAAHDRDRWLALFASDGVIEDPVGAAPHRDADARARFWDVFIAPNDIAFDVHHDIVDGDAVVRDVTIHTRLSGGARVAVPTIILYRLVVQDGLRIAHLAAHWEVRRMIPQVLRQGLAGWRASVGLSARMLRRQGLGGSLGYSRGLRVGVFDRGHEVAARLGEAIAAGDPDALAALFAPDAVLAWHGARRPVVDLLDLGLALSAPRSAGWTTAARATLPDGTGGVVLLDFVPRSTRLLGARLFTAF